MFRKFNFYISNKSFSYLTLGPLKPSLQIHLTSMPFHLYFIQYLFKPFPITRKINDITKKAPVHAWHRTQNAMRHLYNQTPPHYLHELTFDIWYKAEYKLRLLICYAPEKQQHTKMPYTLNLQHIINQSSGNNLV